MTSATELTEAQIDEYRDAFKLFDTDGDGTISVQVPEFIIFKYSSLGETQTKIFNWAANPFNFPLVCLIIIIPARGGEDNCEDNQNNSVFGTDV